MTPGILHDLFTGLGLLAGFLVFSRLRKTQPRDDRIWTVVAGLLVGGALGGRLGAWVQHLNMRDNASFMEQWMYGNRSIVSGLVGAYLGAVIAKKLVGYREPTGDLFAPAAAAGMAVGRIGCLLTELPGTPVSWGVTWFDGVPRHPSFIYEIVFQAGMFVLLVRLRGKLRPGDLWIVYLAGYATFRFAVEFVRGNETVLAGLTRPQWFLLVCAPLLIWRVLRVRRFDHDQPIRAAVAGATAAERSA